MINFQEVFCSGNLKLGYWITNNIIINNNNCKICTLKFEFNYKRIQCNIMCFCSFAFDIGLKRYIEFEFRVLDIHHLYNIYYM